MAKTVRTQAMRALDTHKIPYQVHLFPDTIRDAEQVANSIGLPADQVFKTLVLVREDDVAAPLFLFMLPANREVDLRAFAHAVGVKSVRMASHEQAEKVTRLKVGGISALALLNRPFIVYLDQRAASFEQILVSGGQRGVDLQLKVSDLQTLTNATFVQATRDKQ